MSYTDYDDFFPDALHDVSNADVTFTGVDGHYTVKNFCPSGGTVTVTCKAQGGVVITCDKHPDFEDKTGATTQANDFTSFMDQWLKSNNVSLSSQNKSKLYAEYYALHPEAVPLTDSFKQQLVDAGLNKTLKDSDLYWWSYPVTGSDGSVLYTVTFANKQSDSAYWTDTNPSIRGKMNGGYVVIVNGTTYVRSNSGNTVEVANSGKLYKSESELEAALISNNYFPLS